MAINENFLSVCYDEAVKWHNFLADVSFERRSWLQLICTCGYYVGRKSNFLFFHGTYYCLASLFKAQIKQKNLSGSKTRSVDIHESKYTT